MSEATPGGPMPGSTPGEGGQPSEEEVRAYLGQLRQAPADQVVAEVMSGLLNAAQVKLGRQDARLLIDIAAAAVDAGRDRLPEELSQQVDQVLTQLRMAQVDAEREVADQGHDEPSDLGAPSAAGHGAGEGAPAGEPRRPEPDPAPGTSGDAASRLWIPGR